MADRVMESSMIRQGSDTKLGVDGMYCWLSPVHICRRPGRQSKLHCVLYLDRRAPIRGPPVMRETREGFQRVFTVSLIAAIEIRS